MEISEHKIFYYVRFTFFYDDFMKIKKNRYNENYVKKKKQIFFF